jgi:hypothetical protein
MTVADARAQAEEAIRIANEMNASSEHVPSKQRAEMAGLVLSLCAQLDAAQAEIARLVGLGLDATKIAALSATDRHLGAVGE